LAGPGYVASAAAVTGALSDTLLNSYKKNADSFAAPANCRLRAVTTPTQTFVTATPTAVNWDTFDYDSVGGFNHALSATRYTVQPNWAGMYTFDATIWLNTNSGAAGQRIVRFAVNTTVVPGSSDGYSGTPGASPMSVSATLKWPMAVGEFVEVIFLQQTSANETTSSGGSSSGEQSCFEIEWVSAA
jgi:hypothetical protein